MGKPYELFEGTVQGTGWPIDGHKLIWAIWEYDRSSYHLFTWDDADDEAVMLTQFQTAVEAGFVEDDLEKFKAVWKDFNYDPPGPFCIDLDKLVDVKKVEPDNGSCDA